MSDIEPLYHVRRGIRIAEREGLDDEKEVLEQAHNEIISMRKEDNDE